MLNPVLLEDLKAPVGLVISGRQEVYLEVHDEIISD